jgi:hypothetical protein
VCLIRTHLCNKMCKDRTRRCCDYTKAHNICAACAQRLLCGLEGVSSSRTEQEMANFSSNPPTLQPLGVEEEKTNVTLSANVGGGNNKGK